MGEGHVWFGAERILGLRMEAAVVGYSAFIKTYLISK
jgi:hypothetical protein